MSNLQRYSTLPKSISLEVQLTPSLAHLINKSLRILDDNQQQRLSRRRQLIQAYRNLTNDESLLQSPTATLHRQSFDGRLNAHSSSADQRQYLGLSPGQFLQLEQEEQQLLRTSNQGFHDNRQQIDLQQMQQQRPGRQGQPQTLYNNLANGESYLQSPTVALQRQSFDGWHHERASSMGQTQYLGNADSINSTTKFSPHTYPTSNQHSSYDSQPSQINDPDSGANISSEYPDISTSTWELEDDWNTTIQPASQPVNRQIGRNTAVRMPQFDGRSTNHPPLRPETLPGHLPSTLLSRSAPTPHSPPLERNSIYQRFEEDYLTSMNTTIKSSGRGSRVDSDFQQMRDQAAQNDSEGHSKVPPSTLFGHISSYESPYDSEQDKVQSSRPEIPDLDARESLPEYFQEHYGPDLMSSSINPDESHQDPFTAVMNSYIRPPHTSSMHPLEYSCGYPQGGKTCGKRDLCEENIRAHLFTHVDKRRFLCDQCGKYFQRKQHLTRHIKEVHCQKVAKRGRPRKPRPDDEVRTAKALKTRRSVRLTKERSNTALSEASSSDVSEYLGN